MIAATPAESSRERPNPAMNEASILIAFRCGSRFRLPNEEMAMPKSSISRRIPSCSRSGIAISAAARRSITARSAISRQREEAGSLASAIACAIFAAQAGIRQAPLADVDRDA